MPVPLYGEAPPVADTVTVAESPKQLTEPAVAETVGEAFTVNVAVFEVVVPLILDIIARY